MPAGMGHDMPIISLKQRNAKVALKFFKLNVQGGLRGMTQLSGPPEMARLGKCDQIL